MRKEEKGDAVMGLVVMVAMEVMVMEVAVVMVVEVAEMIEVKVVMVVVYWRWKRWLWWQRCGYDGNNGGKSNDCVGSSEGDCDMEVMEVTVVMLKVG